MHVVSAISAGFLFLDNLAVELRVAHSSSWTCFRLNGLVLGDDMNNVGSNILEHMEVRVAMAKRGVL